MNARRRGQAGINISDLLLGEQQDGGAHSEHRVEQLRAGYVYLPLYDVNASAGKGELIGQEHVATFSRATHLLYPSKSIVI